MSEKKYNLPKSSKKVAIILCLIVVILCSIFTYVHLGSLDIEHYDDIPANTAHDSDHNNETVFGISVSSLSSREVGRIGKNIILENISEPINLRFDQTGRNREMLLQIYYDYQSVNFRVDDGPLYQNSYLFSIRDGEEINLTIYLDPKIEVDDKYHRLIFIIIPSYNEHAKDKENPVYQGSIVRMYQLQFDSLKEDGECPESLFPLTKPEQIYPHKSIPLMLNTDISNLSLDSFSGLKNPSSYYMLEPGSIFKLNYIITNTTPPSEQALIFLTIGGNAVQINGQDYLLIDLGDGAMSVGEITVTVPQEEGLYDVIGYVVYNPFSPLENGIRSFPKPSIRFTVEISK